VAPSARRVSRHQTFPMLTVLDHEFKSIGKRMRGENHSLFCKSGESCLSAQACLIAALAHPAPYNVSRQVAGIEECDSNLALVLGDASPQPAPPNMTNEAFEIFHISCFSLGLFQVCCTILRQRTLLPFPLTSSAIRTKRRLHSSSPIGTSLAAVFQSGFSSSLSTIVS